MGLRKLHRILGLSIALLVILQVLGGMLLRLGVHSRFFFNVHTWFKFLHVPALALTGAVLAVLLGLGLGIQAVSGVVMYITLKVQQARRKAKAALPPKAPPAV